MLYFLQIGNLHKHEREICSNLQIAGEKRAKMERNCKISAIFRMKKCRKRLAFFAFLLYNVKYDAGRHFPEEIPEGQKPGNIKEE